MMETSMEEMVSRKMGSKVEVVTEENWEMGGLEQEVEKRQSMEDGSMIKTVLKEVGAKVEVVTEEHHQILHCACGQDICNGDSGSGIVHYQPIHEGST